jgi:hypothetical protein
VRPWMPCWKKKSRGRRCECTPPFVRRIFGKNKKKQTRTSRQGISSSGEEEQPRSFTCISSLDKYVLAQNDMVRTKICLAQGIPLSGKPYHIRSHRQEAAAWYQYKCRIRCPKMLPCWWNSRKVDTAFFWQHHCKKTLCKF